MTKQLFLSLSLAAVLLSCKKADTTPSNPSTNSKDTTQTSIAKYGDGVTDIDGNNYKTVIIGTQEWMGENLKVSKYNDGKLIPNVIDNIEWSKLTSAAFCNYNNSDSIATIYGKLYNWYAVDTKNLCPTGWHVPTKQEIINLILFLKGDSLDIDVFSKVGLKIKEKGIAHWLNFNSADNLSLFSLLPNGARRDDGIFYGLGNSAGLWTASEKSNTASYIFGTSNKTMQAEDIVGFGDYGKGFGGYSIRCVKD